MINMKILKKRKQIHKLPKKPCSNSKTTLKKSTVSNIPQSSVSDDKEMCKNSNENMKVKNTSDRIMMDSE